MDVPPLVKATSHYTDPNRGGVGSSSVEGSSSNGMGDKGATGGSIAVDVGFTTLVQPWDQPGDGDTFTSEVAHGSSNAAWHPTLLLARALHDVHGARQKVEGGVVSGWSALTLQWGVQQAHLGQQQLKHMRPKGWLP